MRLKNSVTSFLSGESYHEVCRGRDSHGGVTAGGVEDVVPLLLGQLTVPVFVSLVEHLLDLNKYNLTC